MHKYIYRKSILILWIILEVILAIVFEVMVVKKGTYHPHGVLIDESFLNTLVQYELYKSLVLIFSALLLFFGCGLVFYIIGFRKIKHGTFTRKDRSLIFGVIGLPLGGFVCFALPLLITMQDRMNEPPQVQTEPLVDVREFHHKNGVDYEFIFGSGNYMKVSKGEYLLAPIGRNYYIVYQGQTLIDAFPTDKYVLRLK